MTFEKFGLTKKVLRTLESLGLHEATPLQERIIDSLMRNRRIMVCAPHGAGKTTALLVALIARLQKNPPPEGRPVRAVIVTPPVGVGHEVVERFNILAAGTNLSILNLSFQRTEKRLRTYLENKRPDILVGSLARMVEFARISDVSHIEAVIYERLDRSIAEEGARPYELWTNIFPEAVVASTLEDGSYEKIARDVVKDAEEWFDSDPGPIPGTVDYFLAANFRFPHMMYDLLRYWSEENGYRNILLVTKDEKERERFLLGEGRWKGRIATATLQDIEARRVWPSDYDVSYLWPSLLSPEDNARAACRGTIDAAPVTVALVISETVSAFKRLALHLDRKRQIINPIGVQFAVPFETATGDMARRWTALHPFFMGPQYEIPVRSESGDRLEKAESVKVPEGVESIVATAETDASVSEGKSASDSALEFLRSNDVSEASESTRSSEVKKEKDEASIPTDTVKLTEPIEKAEPLDELAPAIEASEDASSDIEAKTSGEVPGDADVATIDKLSNGPRDVADAEISEEKHPEPLHTEGNHRRTLTIRADYVAEKVHAPETEIVITEPLSSSSAALRASERRHAASERLTHQLVAEQGKNRRMRRMPHLPSDSTGVMPEKSERKSTRDRKDSERRERLKTEKSKVRANESKAVRRKEVKSSEQKKKKSCTEPRRERTEKTECNERIVPNENAVQRATSDDAVLLVRFNEKELTPPESSAARGAFKVYFAARDLARRSRQLTKAERDSATAEAELEALRASDPEAVDAELLKFEAKHDRSVKIPRGEVASLSGTPVEEAIVRAHNARIGLELARRNHRQAYYAKAKTEMRYAGDVPEALRSNYGVTDESFAAHVAWKREQAENVARTPQSVAESAEARPGRREDAKKPTQRAGKRTRGGRATDAAAGAVPALNDDAEAAKTAQNSPEAATPNASTLSNAPKPNDISTPAVEAEGAKASRRAASSKVATGKRAKNAEKGEKNRGAKGRRDSRSTKLPRPQSRLERDEAGDVNGNRALPEPKEEFLDDDFGNSIHYRTIAERQAAKARSKNARISDGIPSPLATSFGVYTPDPYGSLSLPQTMPGLTGRAHFVHVFGSGTDPYSGARIPPMRDKSPSGKKGPSSKASKGQKPRQPSKAQTNPKSNVPGKGASDRARKGARRGGSSKA